MGSRRCSNSMPRQADSIGFLKGIVGFLQEELRASHARELKLQEMLMEKDAQVRLVLEEKYFHPVETHPIQPAETKRTGETDDLADTVQFSAQGDKEAIAKQIELED